MKHPYTHNQIVKIIDQGYEKREEVDQWCLTRGLCNWAGRAGVPYHVIDAWLQSYDGKTNNDRFYWPCTKRGFNQRMMFLAFTLTWLEDKRK